MNRKRLFEIIEVAERGDKASMAYDIIMIIAIIVSLIPLTTKTYYEVFFVTDTVTVVLFIIDYVLRFITADYKLKKTGVRAFLEYPFHPIAIVDLLSILPFFIELNPAFKLLRLVRILQLLRMLRVFKLFSHSRSLRIVMEVVRQSRQPLLIVVGVALGYIIVSALVVFNVEPETFGSFFDALYWATISLTTVGYGDLYPVSTVGRIVAMISSFLGVGVIALPAGIISAGCMKAIEKEDKEEKEDRQ